MNDPVLLMAAPDATEEDIALIMESFGLDQHLLVQYVYYLKELSRGNFGYSFLWNRPVLGRLIDRMQATLLLIFTGFIVGFTKHFPGDP